MKNTTLPAHSFAKTGFLARLLKATMTRLILPAIELSTTVVTVASPILQASQPTQNHLIPNHALKFYGGVGLDRKHPRLAEMVAGDKSDKNNLLDWYCSPQWVRK